MEENKNPLESELAEALADVVMDEDNDDKHETFIKRFDTPDEIVQYWEHQLEKVKKIVKLNSIVRISKKFHDFSRKSQILANLKIFSTYFLLSRSF